MQAACRNRDGVAAHILDGRSLAAELRMELLARTGALHDRGVLADSRDRYLRLGPAPYLSDQQLDAAVGLLGDAIDSMR